MASQVIPPNAVKTPSGNYAFFPLKAHRPLFIPFISDQEEYAKILQNLQIQQQPKIYAEVKKQLSNTYNNIDEFVQKMTQYTKHNFIDQLNNDFIKEFEKIKGGTSTILRGIRKLIIYIIQKL